MAVEANVVADEVVEVSADSVFDPNEGQVFNEDLRADLFDHKVYGPNGEGDLVFEEAGCIGRVLSTGYTVDITQYDRMRGEVNLAENIISTNADIEVSWVDSDGQADSAVVNGTQKLLTTSPEKWNTYGNPAYIPNELMKQSFWPPMPGRDGIKWTKLAKAVRSDETENSISVTKMGWFHSNGESYFVTGNKAIGADGASNVVRPAKDLGIAPSVAKRIDVELVPQESPDRSEQMVADITWIIGVFLHLFNVLGYGALLLAAALRPVVPLRPETTLFLVGSPASGKSLAASLVMSGWQAEAGTWNEKSLPGQALDTNAYGEIARSATPIWVADDIAPATSEQLANQRLDDAQDTVRSQTNGSAKGRSSASGKAQVLREPQSQLIMTAENAFKVASANQRAVIMNFFQGIFNEDKLASAKSFRDYGNQLSRVIGYVIEHIALEAKVYDWRTEVAEWQFEKRTIHEEALKTIKETGIKDRGAVERFAAQAADLSLGLRALEQLAQSVGMDISDEIDNAIKDLIVAIGEGHSDYKNQALGAAVVSTIGSMIAIRKGHLKPADDVLRVLSQEEQDALYDSIGYEQDIMGAWVAPNNSLMLGYVKTAKDGSLYGAIEKTNFKAIQTQSNGAIPHGNTAAGAFRAVKDEGFAPTGVAWVKDKNGEYFSKVNIGKNNTRECAPIILSDLLAGHKVSMEELAEIETKTV